MSLNSILTPSFLFPADMIRTSIIRTRYPAVFFGIMSFRLDIDQMCFRKLEINGIMDDCLGYAFLTTEQFVLCYHSHPLSFKDLFYKVT